MDRDEILRVLRAFEAAGVDCARPDVPVQKFRSVEDMRHPDG